MSNQSSPSRPSAISPDSLGHSDDRLEEEDEEITRSDEEDEGTLKTSPGSETVMFLVVA